MRQLKRYSVRGVRGDDGYLTMTELPGGKHVSENIEGIFEFEDGATAVVNLGYENDRHVVTKVTFTADRPIRATDLRVPLDTMADVLVAREAHGPDSNEFGFVSSDFPETLAEVEGRRRRRQMTPEFLRDVAEEWSASGESVQALVDRWPASRSQAYRWIKLAKEAGYIEEDEL